MLFRLKTGSYCALDGTMHTAKTKSAIVESAIRLDLKFRNKFERVINEAGQVLSSPTASVAIAATDVVSANVILAKAEAAVVEAKAIVAKFEAVAEASVIKEVVPVNPVQTEKAIAGVKPTGNDVTLLFPIAKTTQFKVHKNGELFDIADATGSKVNPDPLTKELVVMYLKNNA